MKYLILLALPLLLLSGCKKAETNYCLKFNDQPEILTFEPSSLGYGPDEPQHYTDTLIKHRLGVRVDEYYDRYQWIIGEESKIREGKTVGISFPDSFHERIRILFIGHRPPSPNCKLGDDGIDSVITWVTFMPWDIYKCKPIGKWYGGDVGTDEKDTITIMPNMHYDDYFLRAYIYGFPHGSKSSATYCDTFNQQVCRPVGIRYSGFQLQNSRNAVYIKRERADRSSYFHGIVR